MPYDDNKPLRVITEEGVAHLTIDNPPVNMLDTALITELKRFADEVRVDDSVRVIVAGSANDDFFFGGFSACPFAQRVGGTSTTSGPRPVGRRLELMFEGWRAADSGDAGRPG